MARQCLLDDADFSVKNSLTHPRARAGQLGRGKAGHHAHERGSGRRVADSDLAQRERLTASGDSGGRHTAPDAHGRFGFRTRHGDLAAQVAGSAADAVTAQWNDGVPRQRAQIACDADVG